MTSQIHLHAKKPPLAADTDTATTSRGRPASSGPGNIRRRVLDLTTFVLGPLLFLAIWEWAGRSGVVGDGLFPPFSKTVSALLDWMFGTGDSLYSGQWASASGASILRILVGFTVGALVAIVLGVLTGRLVVLRNLIDPTINFIRPISIVAWVPLALVVFGIGNKPAIFLTALATFFPVYVATVSGVRYASRGLVLAARMLGAKERQLMRRVVLPAALPSIMTGVRVGLGIAWTTVIVAEMLGAKSGLGYTLYDSYQQFQTQFVTAAMISIGILGLLSDRLLMLLSAPVLRWTDGADGA
jgi:ABC-type nitrate/sulfonate/bicarbonate transport system permease component